MIFDTSLGVALGLSRFDSELLNLLAKRVEPGTVSLGLPRDDIILGTILEFFLAQFNASLKFDFLHATVLRLSVDVVSRHEKALMSVELLD